MLPFGEGTMDIYCICNISQMLNHYCELFCYMYFECEIIIIIIYKLAYAYGIILPIYIYYTKNALLSNPISYTTNDYVLPTIFLYISLFRLCHLQSFQ